MSVRFIRNSRRTFFMGYGNDAGRLMTGENGGMCV